MNAMNKKCVGVALLAALLLQMVPAVYAADTTAVETTAETAVETTAVEAVPVTGTFKNLSENGEDMISLAEKRDYKVMIPVDDATIDPATVTWKMIRDTARPYNDAEKYSNQIDLNGEGVTLDAWKNDVGENFFSDVVTAIETIDGQTYLTATFSGNTFFYYTNWWTGESYEDNSAPHANGGYYLDSCGWFFMTANVNETELGRAEVKIAPYDAFHTMAEVYADMDAMVDFAEANTDVYLEEFSMGTSSGDIYEAMDMPYMILADDRASVDAWLAFTEAAETDPTGTLAKIEAGEYDDLRVPVLYSNIHANEVAATDGILEFTWMLLEAAATEEGTLSYNNLTGLTEEGKAQLDTEMAEQGMHVPDLVADTATYLGFLREGKDVSGVVDMDKYYEQETVTTTVDELLSDVFFILVPEENVEGREYVTRYASNGYDLNRDNSFQTTEETQNMQHLIAAYNPVSFVEFHGRVEQFQCEPCDPPHEPNFEYDLLAEHLMTGGEALGIAAVANNEAYNSYVIPQRDYLYTTVDEEGNEVPYWEPWDDMSTSYTPQFAMLQGTVSYTVELPAYNDDTTALVQYGILGQANYVAGEKIGYLTAQTKIFERGVTNANSDAYELVGQWLTDQYDIEGAEMDIFRPEFDGEDENGNFYPECYIIPMDAVNQSNLQAARDMMVWLSRNDVKILLTESEFTYEGVTYPAGTMIVSMYQAKRSVANGALYDGTLIQNWSDLYSEGITTFNETRGFDMVTVTEPAAYTEIAAVCGDWMDYDTCVAYAATVTSVLTGEGEYVVISNASEDSTAAINALLNTGDTVVSMVTDADSPFYGDFITSYEAWLTVADHFVLTGTAVTADNAPASEAINGAPVVYITGVPSQNESGFVWTSRVTNTNWNYDRIAMEMMGFTVTTDPAEADVIVGASALNADALAAVKSGTPYIGYSSSAARAYGELFGESLVRDSAYGMDCLAYVTYPTTNLVNASYVMDNDDVLYGYGVGYFTAIPEGAEVLVQMDGTRTPTEGFVQAIDDEQKAYAEAYLNGSIQGFAYEGADVEGNEINVVLFANTLTNKGHQRDEYAYISNFIFSNMLVEKTADTTVVEETEVVEAPAETTEVETETTVEETPVETTEVEETAVVDTTADVVEEETVSPSRDAKNARYYPALYARYDVTLQLGDGVTANTKDNFTMHFGARRTINFTVADGYEIVSITVNGEAVDVANSYTITSASEDYTIVVTTAAVAE